MDVSIVVLTWEDFERTNACVRSLPSAAEVVVVDNGSAADISSALQAMCDETGARYLRSEVNLGYAKGMNLGVRHTTRSRVVLSNNDIVVRTAPSRSCPRVSTIRRSGPRFRPSST